MEAKSIYLLLSNMRHMSDGDGIPNTSDDCPQTYDSTIDQTGCLTTIAMGIAIQAMLSRMTQANSAIMMEMVAEITLGVNADESPTIIHNVLIQMETVMETILAATAPINSHWTQLNGTIPMTTDMATTLLVPIRTTAR